MIDVNATYSKQFEKFVDARVCTELPAQYQKDCLSYVHTALPEM
jgi:hypothetical protein